ncbi:unnamed protein product, partial [marine sediment metagenome]
EDGEDGISITWMGTATSAPKSWRVLNYAYYNSYKGKSYIWDGNSWEIWARDGATGATGATGPRGLPGDDAECVSLQVQINALEARIAALEPIPPVPPTIDGVIGAGEWDGYYLGTSETTWSGGMSVDVYGFADDTYLYAAYVVDTSQPGWSQACELCVNCNFYYYTTKDTLLSMWAWGEPYQVQQTEDWISWDDLGTLGDVGIEYWYMDMYTQPNPGIAELRIPLSLLGTEGADQIELYGQYWQYDWAEPFLVTLPS